MKECVSIVDKQIRAGHLSGDCHLMRELLRGYIKLQGHEQVSFPHFTLLYSYPVFTI